MSLMRELSFAGKIAAVTAIVWATPPRHWRRLAELGVDHGEQAFGPIFRRALGIANESALSALCRARRVALRETMIQVLGLAGPWRRWRPPIRLHGEEHLTAALERGKGAILWASGFLYTDLIYKIALRQAGYRATQLYRPAHGFGRSKLAVGLLNPLWIAVEGRFLEERVMIHGDDTMTAVGILRSRLAENGIVVIFVGNEGRRTVEPPFFNHRIRIATGPINIARSTGAALIPLFAVRAGDGVYDVVLEEPLDGPPADAGAKSFGEIAADLARRTERYASRYPEQWRGWNELIAIEPPGESACLQDAPLSRSGHVSAGAPQAGPAQ